MDRRRHITPKIRSLRKKEKLWEKPWFWVTVSVAVVLGAGVYVVYFLPMFQIKNITVSGNETIAHESIKTFTEQSVLKKIIGIPSRSIFLESSGALAASITREFPEIEKAWVQKVYPSTLTVSVKERHPFSVFCQALNCFFIDHSGVIFKPINGFPEGMIIASDTVMEMAAGKHIVEKHIIDLIGSVQMSLKENFSVNVTHALVANPVIFTTTEGWKIYVNPEGDIPGQVARMNALLKNQIPTTARTNLQYIYLQYNDRAYYK